ncbi:ester cyclase [Pyxidicoccus caerfyrddinensis]|uniref:ester cyclase n=1 Tax=Pyxidicoccus caerfyrddinensis TaxID=2709663 RepID=UPI0013D9CE3C|nr:ester cyclase [Pyxidicoccus caerfyrddinensis]
MSKTEENKALIRYYVEEVFNKADWSKLEGLVAPGYINHSPVPGAPQGIEGFRQVVESLHAGFPDVQNTIDDIFAEGELVLTRWTARSTHTGTFMGIPPTGRKVTVSGLSIDRVVDGEWVEGWAEFDQLGLLRQLGVLPPAPGGSNDN